MEKDWPKRPSDHQLQEFQKKTLIGPELLWWRQSVSLHTWGCQGPRKPSSFTLNSHWGELPQAKIVLCLCVQDHLGRVRLCNSVDCGLPGFSVTEGSSPGKNTGAYWPILVAIPYWSTIFPAALAANPPEYLVLPEPLQPKQLHHLHTWPSQGQTQVLQGSLRSKPQWTTHMQRWK